MSFGRDGRCKASPAEVSLPHAHTFQGQNEGQHEASQSTEAPLGRSPSLGHHIPANFLLNFRNDQRHEQVTVLVRHTSSPV